MKIKFHFHFICFQWKIKLLQNFRTPIFLVILIFNTIKHINDVSTFKLSR